MHGKYTTLKDIVLDLTPDPVGLHCNEQLDSSEDEVDEQATQATQATQHSTLLQCYQILTSCSKCCSNVRLVVECTGPDIHDLHDLLLGTLNIVCPLCAPKS